MRSTLLAASLLLSMGLHAQTVTMVTGTYTSGKSEGIYVGNLDLATGEYKPMAIGKGIKNPSFLAFGKGANFLYAVSESKDGKVSSYLFDKASGQLTKINEQSSAGDDPCHLAVDRSGKWVAAGNYSSGSLGILPINGDGTLGSPTDRVVHKGQGADKTRQEAPHVHETVFSADNRFLYVPDLGLDRVYIYAFDAQKGKIKPAAQPFAQLKPASGPRHILFHPRQPIAYVLNEINGTVNAYKVDVKTGALKETGSWSTLPAGTTGAAGCAELQFSPNGKFLYCSNRYEQNTIAIYKLDEKTGGLTALEFPSTQGKHPRHFTFDPSGKWLLVANRDNDEVVLFKTDPATGSIKDSGKRISIPSPVCVIFAPAPSVVAK